MLNELLWIYAGNRQYKLQKESGVAGLIGFIIAFAIILNWNTIVFPLLEAVGLVSLAEKTGTIVEGNGVLTFANVLFNFTLFLFLLSAFMALPTFLALALMSVFSNNNSNKPTVLQMTIGFCLAPLVLIIFIMFKLLGKLKLTPTLPKSAVEYAKGQDNMKHLINRLDTDRNEQDKILDMFVIQQGDNGHPITTREVSFEEAQTYLNRAVLNIEQNPYFLLAYCEPMQKHMFLLPNPIPPYASICANVDSNEVTPYNYTEHAMNYYDYLKKNTKKPNFYVPARFIDFTWDKDRERVTVAPDKKYGTVYMSLTGVNRIVEVRGDVIDKLYNECLKDGSMQRMHDKVHAIAYTIPLPYPDEVNKYKDPSTVVSYYRELEKVPNVVKYAPHNKRRVLEHIQYKARRNLKWAKQFLDKKQLPLK